MDWILTYYFDKFRLPTFINKKIEASESIITNFIICCNQVLNTQRDKNQGFLFELDIFSYTAKKLNIKLCIIWNFPNY
jgi:hypothetical protein